MNEPTRSSLDRQGSVSQVVAAYLEAVQAGQPPDPEDVIARHPEIARELREIFCGHNATLTLPGAAGAAGDAGPTPTVDAISVEPSDHAEPARASGLVGARFGDYEVLGELARGGMGVVYRAHQRSANRVVALKMILARELASDDEVRRFRREAELAANLDHPHIVPIYEVGEYQGQHFFSMKLIEGDSLAGQLARYPADPRAAAALVARVARAVHHAHQRGVLHRDLKPGNILLDAHADPHVTDFGLAKKAEADGVTQSGAILGTPEYMAPEQASAGVVTTAADVYGLGAVLYALLAGRPPFRGESVLETLRQVLERQPPLLRPRNPRVDRDLETICLKCLHKDPAKRYASAADLADDLERWLTGRPILARPVGRAERLVLWVRRRPVVAALLVAIVAVAAVGLGAFIWQYQDALEQKRIADSERETALQRAREIEDKSKEIANNLRELGKANRQISDRMAAEKELRKQSELRYQTLRQTTVNARLIEAVSLAADRPGKARRLLEDTDSFPLDLRDFAWAYHRGQLKREPALVTAPGGVQVLWHAFSADGKLLAWRARDGTTQGIASSRAVALWDVEGRSVLASLAHKAGPISAAAFSPDGKLLATGTMAREGVGPHVTTEVKVWETATGREVHSLAGLPATVDQLAFSPDGKLLAIGLTFALVRASSRSAEVRVWDTAAGSKTHSWQGSRSGFTALAFSPDGKHLAALTDIYGAAGKLGLFDTATGTWRTLGAVPLGASALTFSPDNRWLAVCGAQGPGQLAPQPGTLPPGGRLEVWDLSKEPDRPVIVRAAHRRPIIGVAFTPDSKGLLSWDSADAYQGKPAPADAASVKLWDPTGRERLSIPFSNGSPYNRPVLALTEDRTRVAVKYGDEVQLWDLATGQQKGTFRGQSLAPSALAFSPDGQTLFVTDQQDVVVLDGQSLNERDRLPARPPPGPLPGGHVPFYNDRLAVSADGSRLALSSDSLGFEANPRPGVMTWDLRPADQAERRQRVALEQAPAPYWPQSVAFTPDGRLLAVAHGPSAPLLSDGEGGELEICAGPLNPRAPGTVVLLDGLTGRQRATLFQPATPTAVALSADGRLLAAACSRLDAAGRPRAEVALWEVDTGRKLRTLAAFDQAVYALAFSADGRLLGAGGEGEHEITEKGPVFGGGRVKVWDARTGQERAAFATSDRVYALAFSPDGKRLAAGSVRFQTAREWPHTSNRPAQGEVRVWDIDAGREHATFARHRAGVRALAFSPDGRVLATGGFDHAIKLWDVPARRELRTLSDHAGPLQALAYSADGLSLVSVSLDRTVKVWNTLTTQARLTLRAGPAAQPGGVVFRSDGLGLLIVGTGDSFVELRRLGTSPEPALLPDSGAPLLLSADGSTLAAANAAPGRNPGDRRSQPGVIRLWDTATGQGREPLTGHAFPIAALLASRDGKLLVSVANPDDTPAAGSAAPGAVQPWQGEVKLWDAASGQETASLPRLRQPVRAVALQPGGSLLAVVCGGRAWKGSPPSLHWQASTVLLFDTQDGHQVRPLAGHEGDVRALAFSADGKRLAVFSSGAPVPAVGEPGGATSAQILRPCRLQTWDIGSTGWGGREASSLVLPLPRPDRALFSDDGRRLITEAGGQVQVWDVATGTEEHALAGYPAPMRGVALTPDGKTAVTMGGGGVKVWDIRTLRQRHHLPGADSYALVGGGTILRARSHVFDLDSGRPLAPADSVILVSANGRALLRQKDTNTLEVIHRPDPGSNEPPRSVPLSGPIGYPRFLTPDGRTLIAGSSDGMTVKLWDTATGRERAACPGHVTPDPLLSPDGKVLVVRGFQPSGSFPGGGSGLALWDVATGKRIATWENPETRAPRLAAVAALVGWGSAPSPLARVAPALRVHRSLHLMAPPSQLAFSPDGKALVVVSGGVTFVLDAATGQQVAVWNDRPRAYASGPIHFLPDGKAVLIGEYGANLETGQPGLRSKLREFPSGRARGELPADTPTFTPDSRTILTWVSPADAAPGGEVLVWDVATGRLRRRITNVPASPPPTFQLPLGGIPTGGGLPGQSSLLPSPDGRFLAAWSSRLDGPGRVASEVAWWDLDSGRQLGRLRAVPDFRGGIQWAPDGKSLCLQTGAGFRQLRTADGAEPVRFQGATAPFAITPDSQFLLASVPEGVRVWDLATGAVHGTLRHQASVYTLALHPDGPTLLTNADSGLKLWDLASGKEVPADSRRTRALLDGRLRLAQDLSDPWSFYQPVWLAHLLEKNTSPGPTTVLINDRFRLVHENQSLALWPTQRAGPAAASDSSEVAAGMDMAQKGRLEEAVAAFRKAARAAPRDTEVRLLLADALDRRGERDEAAKVLTEACRQDPRHAWLFAALGRPRTALKLLDQAVYYRPQDAALHFQRGEVLAVSGDKAGALACYEKCLALEPDHGRAWARLADLRLEQGEAAAARQARRRLGEISPALANPEREQTVQAHLVLLRKDFGGNDAQMGNRLSWNSYFDEAIPYLQRGAWKQPNELFPLDALGLCLSGRGRYAEALGPLRRGLALAPEINRPWWTGEIGYAERSSDFEALRKQARSAEDLFRSRPADAQAGRAVADAHARILQYPKNARDYFAPGAELPTDPEVWFNLAAMLLLGQDTDLHRRLAEHALGQAAKLTAPQEGSRIRNAYVIARLCALADKPPGVKDRLLPLAEQAAKESPDAWILHTLGLVHYRAGSYEDAVHALERSVKEHPEWAAQVVNYQALALAYHRLGKAAEARRWRRRATERIERMEDSVAVRSTGRWPLHPHDLLSMWLLERETAREMPAH